jgi:hypothetical protein
MKKLIAFLFTIHFSLFVFAQKGSAEFSFYGGVSLPKYSYANAGSSGDRNVYQGYTGGVTLMVYDLSHDSPGIGLGLGAQYVEAGAINKAPSITGAIDAKNRINYIRTEVLMGLKIQEFLEVSGGLYISKAMSGESIVSLTNGATTTSPLVFGTKITDDFIPYDLGIGFNANFNISRIKLGISLHEGFSDIAPQADIKIRNSIYAFTLGLRLGGKKH